VHENGGESKRGGGFWEEMGEEVANYISFGKESGKRKEHLLIQTIITFSLLAVAVHISFIG